MEDSCSTFDFVHLFIFKEEKMKRAILLLLLLPLALMATPAPASLAGAEPQAVGAKVMYIAGSCSLKADGSHIKADWVNLFGDLRNEKMYIIRHNPAHLYKMWKTDSGKKLKLAIYTGPNFQKAKLIASRTCS